MAGRILPRSWCAKEDLSTEKHPQKERARVLEENEYPEWSQYLEGETA